MGKTFLATRSFVSSCFLALLVLLTVGRNLTPSAMAAGPDAALQKRLPPEQAKALESWSYALALNAATWGSPAVIMHNLRYNDALGPNPKAAPNSIWRMANISTPKLSEEAGYVTPNVNTVYGFGFLDLGPQPIIMTLPNSGGRYYMVEVVDMWTNAFAYPAGVDGGYEGGKFALVGPGWSGELPSGIKRIDAPTRWVLIQPRVHLKDQTDLSGAKKILEDITVQSLAEYLGKPARAEPRRVFQVPAMKDARQPVSALDYTDPLQFWDILSETMNENPPPGDQMTGLVPMFQPLGLELGKVWDRTKVHPLVLEAMKRAAQDIGPLLNRLPAGEFINGWFLSPATVGNFGTDFRTRAITARIGLTANTPREAVYFLAKLDEDFSVLAGTNRYSLTFPKTPPYIRPGFWSLTLYDGNNNYTVPNSINRYALGSDDPLKANDDGSLTIYLSRSSPGDDRKANWLPTPSGQFYLVLRAYAPGEAMIEALVNPRAYTPPVIKRMR
jgi:hypothetical protein